MKILVITNLFPNNREPNRGIFNKQQFLELAKLCDIKVVAPVAWHKSGGIKYEDMVDGIETYYPKYFMTPKILRSLYGIFLFFGIIGTIKKIRKDFNFDAILATWAYPDGFAASLVARTIGKPLVIKVHGSDINVQARSLIRRVFIKYAMKRCGKVIAVTDALKEAIKKIGIEEAKIVVIKNGVDRDLFKHMDRSGHAKTILFIGNLVLVKGVNYLLEAFTFLARRGEKVYLKIVGGGPQEKSLKDACRKLGISEYVTFAGRIPHGQMPLWINNSDLLCLPSMNEGCPNVVLEAMACGKPVVVSRVGGLPEITSYDTGILVEPRNTRALAEALIEALARRWDSEAIRKRSLEFSWQDSAIKIKDMIDNVIRAYPGNRRETGLKSRIKALMAYIIPKKIILWQKLHSNEVALTFDDGPNAAFTPRILEILKQKNVRATFFLVGNAVEQNKELTLRIAGEGHTIGMHSYSHYKYREMGSGERIKEIIKSKDILSRYVGIAANLFRPPQGLVFLSQLLYCWKNKIITVLSSVDSADYKKTGLNRLKKRLSVGSINGGDIILFHDDNEFTIQVLPEIIDNIRNSNFNFVTVEEMLK